MVKIIKKLFSRKNIICLICNTKNYKHHKFCEGCGSIIEAKKELKIKLSKNPLIYFYLGIAGFLIVLFFLIAPTKSYFYNIEVPYEDVEYYYEKEPYEYQEAYQAQEPYQTTEIYYDQVPVQRQVTNTAPSGQYYTSCSGNCQCTRYGGLFFTQCVECTCTVTEYQTIPKERPVTKYETTTKYRTVTGYRDVQKSRTVTKIRQEERRYEVNWLFGFRVPWSLHLNNRN